MSREQQTDTERNLATHPGPVGQPRPELLTAVGVYQLLSPLVVGRTVLEVWPLLGDGRTRLEQAGAAEVISLAPDQPSLPLAEASVDVLLCLSGLGPGGRTAAAPWLEEFRRVLQPHGLCVFRTQRSAGDPGPDPLETTLAEGFGRATRVTETPFVGVSFIVPDTEEMAIGGDLARLTRAPSHDLLFVTRAAPSAWPLTESLFTPLHDLQTDLQRRAAWQKEADAERDDLREALLVLQDQLEKREAALAAFRRQNAQRLQKTTDTEGALEALSLEREQLEQRAQRAEKALTDLEVATRRREVEIAALEVELARLRARPPAKPDKPPNKPPGSGGGGQSGHSDQKKNKPSA
jgi:hypothetical protein